jgi:hypothetical protein
MLDEDLYRKDHANETAPRDWQFVSHVWNDRHLRSATGARLTASGVFTAEQAKNGERAFQAKCAGSHGEGLHSTDAEAPDLTEGAFKFGWQGKTLANRFDQIRNTRPLGKSRYLERGSVADRAFILLRGTKNATAG